ncbi:trypsin-1-like isoform X2 [Macrobrachium nipponense]|uniref:trypsin-1-like isoform X2 n=1 Tax=Macrobrachium nipponense TaxID=159736 RepID=UPI0030C7EDFE
MKSVKSASILLCLSLWATSGTFGKVVAGDKGAPAKAGKQTATCGSSTTLAPGQSVTITSENYPNAYTKPQDCTWKFAGESLDSTLTITCSDFRINGCAFSTVDISFGDYSSRYCGEVVGLKETSDSNAMTVVFQAGDRGKAMQGFTCTVTASDPSDPPTPPPQTKAAPCQCGVVNRLARIVGGTETGINEYPWQVALTSSRTGTRPFCGGSLISADWVLTASHCVTGTKPRSLKVVVGDHNWSTTTETASVAYGVKRIIMHPQFNGNTLDYDAALIQLSSVIAFPSDNRIAPICLPTPGLLYENVTATVTGWGTLTSGGSQPYVLYEVDVPTMSNAVCSQSYVNQITDRMICAGVSGKDSCQGDSGGPMVTDSQSGTHKEQIGIVSWGNGCALPNYPGVYSRVSEFVTWIKSNTLGSTDVCLPPP